jgi:hypothetical protein
LDRDDYRGTGIGNLRKDTIIIKIKGAIVIGLALDNIYICIAYACPFIDNNAVFIFRIFRTPYQAPEDTYSFPIRYISGILPGQDDVFSGTCSLETLNRRDMQGSFGIYRTGTIPLAIAGKGRVIVGLAVAQILIRMGLAGPLIDEDSIAYISLLPGTALKLPGCPIGR